MLEEITRANIHAHWHLAHTSWPSHVESLNLSDMRPSIFSEHNFVWSAYIWFAFRLCHPCLGGARIVVDTSGKGLLLSTAMATGTRARNASVERAVKGKRWDAQPTTAPSNANGCAENTDFYVVQGLHNIKNPSSLRGCWHYQNRRGQKSFVIPCGSPRGAYSSGPLTSTA